MPTPKDPTDPIRKKAATYAGVDQGTACNQSSFKAGTGAFLFIGPGARGQGFKAMFKLDRSLPQARELAASEPDRFGVGTGAWVTARFTAERPLPKSIWQRWLKESYELTLAAGAKKKPAKKKAARKR